jgi:hypothetical protein
MNIKQQLTTITRFSKIIALILFISLPIIGFYLGMKFQESILINTAPIVYEQPNSEPSKNSGCDGESNPYYSSGFGVEHTYEGTINSEKNVKIILSCDHEKFTISGAVNQIILSSDIVDNSELADLSSGDLVVGLDLDFNFDGYNDLSSIINNGQGIEAVKTYAIFLFDPQKQQFVYNNELSFLENISVAKEKNLLTQTFCTSQSDGGAKCADTMYKWSNGHLIKL